MLVHVQMSQTIRDYHQGQVYVLDEGQAIEWQRKGWGRIVGKASRKSEPEKSEAKIRKAPNTKTRSAPESGKGGEG